MSSVSAGLWAIIVRPICSAPCTTWRGYHDAIEFSILQTKQPILLSIPVQQVMFFPSHKHVHLVDNQTKAILGTQ